MGGVRFCSLTGPNRAMWHPNHSAGWTGRRGSSGHGLVSLALSGKAGTLARWGGCGSGACVKSVWKRHACSTMQTQMGWGSGAVLEPEQRVGVLAHKQASGEGGAGGAGEGGGRWARGGGVGRRRGC